MASGMKWDKVAAESNRQRWGSDERDGESRLPSPARAWKKPSGMSMEQAKRWADAIQKVYGKKR